MVVSLAETIEESAVSEAYTVPAGSIPLPAAENLDRPENEEHTKRDETSAAGSPHRIVLRQGLPSKHLLEAILFHCRGSGAHQRATAFYLVDFDKREEYKLYTFTTTPLFAEACLGLTLKEAQELLRVGRKLEILEELDEAFARGLIGWAKVREISRVATPETERKWLLYAKSHSMRDIERAVARKKEGDPPPEDGDPAPLRTFLNIMYRLTPKTKLAWETAFAKVSSEFPRGTSNDVIFTYIAEVLLRTARDPEREAKHPPLYTIVYQVGPDGRGWAEFNEGPMEIPLRDIYEIAGKARVIEVPPLAEGEGKAILQGERGTVPKEDRDGPATRAMRFAVSARESHRCAICRQRRTLQGHHSESLALGGRTLLERLLGACIPCHALIHAGLIRLRVLPGGKLEIRDREGNLVREFDLAEMLPPEEILLIERELADAPLVEGAEPTAATEESEACAPQAAEAAACPEVASLEVPAAPAPPPSELCASRAAEAATSRIESARSLAELPPSITPEGFRALSGRIEWSTTRKAFHFHPEREAARVAAADAPVEPVVSRDEAPAHRPETLSDIVGQERVVSNLRRSARLARERGRPFPHTLLLGPAGMGKTSLAEAVAREVDAPIERVFGTVLAEPSQVLPLLASLRRGQILLIDEIHGLSRAATECLHGALEDGHVDIPLVSGAEARVLRIALEPFSVIGATTEPGKLPAPFRARFQEETLAAYSPDALSDIAARAARALGTPATEDAAREVARRSRKTPRGARKLVERAEEFAGVRGSGRIERADVIAAAESLGIDALGLRDDDRRILDLLARRGRPVGIATLAATLRLDLSTAREVHEGYLLEEGLIERTRFGRAITAKGREALGITPALPALPALPAPPALALP